MKKRNFDYSYNRNIDQIKKKFNENVEDFNDHIKMLGKKIKRPLFSIKCSWNNRDIKYDSIESKELSEYRRKEKNKKNKKYLSKSNFFKSVKMYYNFSNIFLDFIKFLNKISIISNFLLLF